MARTGCFALAGLLLGLLLAGCGGSAAPEPPASPDGLPDLDALDALHSVSSSEELSIDPQQFLAAERAAVEGAGLTLSASADDLAWAVYRVDLSALNLEPGALRSLTLSGNGELWVLLADFSILRWVEAGRLDAEAAMADWSPVEQPLSPAGFAYFAVISPKGASGQIDSLRLNYTAPANTFYVSPPQQGGDDANEGSSEAPWATLQHAADSVGPDTMVIVRAGSYAGFKLSQGGEPDGPLVFRAEPGVVINEPAPLDNAGILIMAGEANSGHISIEGFELLWLPGDAIVAQAGPEHELSHLILRDNHCGGMKDIGITLYGISDSLVENNICSGSEHGQGIVAGFGGDRLTLRGNACMNNDQAGLLLMNSEFDGDGRSSQLLIEANACHGNALSSTSVGGLGLVGVEQSTVRNNLLYRNCAGIVLFDGSGEGTPTTGNLLVNNTVYQDSDGGPCVILHEGSSGNLLFNNILLHDLNHAPAIDIDTSSLPGFDSDYNVLNNLLSSEEHGAFLSLEQWQELTGRDLHSVLGNSFNLFASTIENDYHLNGTALARDLALADFAPLSDLDGVQRPQGDGPDIGCYEFADQ